MEHRELAWPILIWLEQSALGVAMRRSLWLYPTAEILHILGIALLVGPAVMFDLRLLGRSRSLSISQVARHLLPWSWRGLLLIVLSGSLMFTAHAPEWAASPVFRLKLGLITLAGLNQFLFHKGIFRSVGKWDRDIGAPRAARAAALLSLGLWTAVIAAGRLLAYL